MMIDIVVVDQPAEMNAMNEPCKFGLPRAWRRSLGAMFAALMLVSAAHAQPERDVSMALDAFHAAAADADFAAYSALMTADIVFLGTDASERWQGDAFRDFARPHFESGVGWTYLPEERSVLLSEDGGMAWFDELLHHEKLGRCRGSGVMLLREGEWKVAQYNLSLPVPNALVYGVAQDIAAFARDPVAADPVSPGPDDSSGSATEVEQQQAGCQRKRHKTNRKAGC
jgi:ketosteroid isomerase-like protein